MKLFVFSPRWFLVLILLVLCLSTAYGRRGGGGSRGGSRGSSSRGSSSRGSSSGSNTSRGTTYDRSRDRSSSTNNRNPPPQPRPEPPKAPPAPKPSAPELPRPAAQPKPSAPEWPSANRPQSKPDLRQNAPNNQQPPPYSPREAPPGYSPVGQQPPRSPGVAPPPYSPGGQQPPYAPGNVAPPPYSPQGVPNANYPRQPGSQGIPNANYPRQPGYPAAGSGPNYQSPQGGVPGANYPRQPGYPAAGTGPNYQSPQGGIPGANYPRQPGGIPGGNYPRQPGGIPGGNYPRQPPVAYPPNTLGGHVWQPHSGMPAPSYMNYGGLPTGSNAYQKPLKKKGLLGSLMTMGSAHKMGSKPKYYGSYPSPYGGGGYGRGGSFGHGGFSGKSAAMYSILPIMAARRSTSFFRPRFGFMPIFLPSPFHSYGYHHGYHNHYHHYDVYNNDYVGKCNRPITPKNANVTCNSTRREVGCEVKCQEGYTYPDNTTNKQNICWHVTGVWRPTKNFPDCKPVCNQTCLNEGSCIGPNICGCSADYRGPLCEYHFLKCDVRKLAGESKIRWVCTHTKNETTCKIKCKDQQEFEKPPSSEVYRCTPEGTWTPNEIPLCIDKGSGIKNETMVSQR